MYVAVFFKCRPQRFIAAELSKQSQCDLRIVGSHQRPAVARNECFAKLRALLRASRDVLQVWVTGTQSTGFDRSLVEGRMNTPKFVCHCWQHINISILEIGRASCRER